MSNKKVNISLIANYCSQIYLIIISVIVLPFYINKLGAESYGLIGFFGMLQGMFLLLDLGLTPTISRQTVNYNSGIETAINYRRLLRALNIIFLSIGLLSIILLFSFKNIIVKKWLNIGELDINDVIFSMNVMFICIFFRWITGLYRGVLVGFEKILWLSLYNSIFATLRFLGVILYMDITGYNIRNFFFFQLIISFFEFLIFFYKTVKTIPYIAFYEIGWSLKPIKKVIKFSLMIAFTSTIWVLLTQMDKFILSGILSLDDYGYFTLATLVAGGILQISAPVSAVIMPRLAALYAEKKIEEMKFIYVTATRFMLVFVVTASIVLACVSHDFLVIWTSNTILANKVSSVLSLYALGNAILILNMFPYYLQYAQGNLKFHFLGCFLQMIILIPIIIIISKEFGSLGTASAWLIMQFLIFILWTPYVHSMVFKGINKLWYSEILKVLLPLSCFCFFISYLLGDCYSKFWMLVKIFVISSLALLISISCIKDYRNKLVKVLLKRFS